MMEIRIFFVLIMAFRQEVLIKNRINLLSSLCLNFGNERRIRTRELKNYENRK